MVRALDIIVCLLLAGAVWSQEKVTDKQIAAAIQQLGADSFRDRKESEKFLWEHGEQAESALREAVKSDDPEIKLRAERILKKVDQGIFPDTPEHLAAILRSYSQGNYTQRRDAGRKLAQAGPEAYPTLFRVLRGEDDQRLRKEILQELPPATELARQLIAGKLDQALFEKIMESRGRFGDGGADYATYLLLKNKLADRLKLIEGLSQKELNAETRAFAAVLLRAAGNPARAAKLLADTDKDHLRESMLLEANDYKTLAKESRYVTADNPTVERLGYAAAYYRLGGRSTRYKTAVEQLLEIGTADPEQSWYVTEALLINGEPEKAIAFLSKVQKLGNAYDILVALLRMKEANELVARAGEEEPERLPYLQLAQARYLAGHGEREKAAQMFARLAKDEFVRSKKDLLNRAISDEARAGFTKAATTHALEAVKAKVTDFDGLIPRAFPAIRDAWTLNRMIAPNETTKLQAERFQLLLKAPLTRKQLLPLLEKAELSIEKLKEDQRKGALRDLAATAKKYGELKQAERLMTALNDEDGLAELLLHRADLEADAGRWKPAYDLYWKHWLTHKSPISLYLAGNALTEMGKKDEGKKLIDQATFLPLGNEQTRWNLANALEERGMRTQAVKQWDLLLRTGTASSWHVNYALRQLARHESTVKKNHLRAAQYLQRSHLYCLDTSAGYTSVTMYLRITFAIHSELAQHWLQKKNFDRAMADTRIALKSLPQNTDFAIDMVRALTEQGRKKDADEVYQAGTQVWLNQLQEYPKSATAYNNMAWLSAGCHRDLQNALKNVTKALELSPNMPAYMDTMAEVQFHLGNRKEAVAYAKKALAAKPKYQFFKDRVKRFETEPLPEK